MAKIPIVCFAQFSDRTKKLRPDGVSILFFNVPSLVHQLHTNFSGLAHRIHREETRLTPSSSTVSTEQNTGNGSAIPWSPVINVIGPPIWCVHIALQPLLRYILQELAHLEFHPGASNNTRSFASFGAPASLQTQNVLPLGPLFLVGISPFGNVPLT